MDRWKDFKVWSGTSPFRDDILSDRVALVTGGLPAPRTPGRPAPASMMVPLLQLTDACLPPQAAGAASAT